jgi:hypothetical protein
MTDPVDDAILKSIKAPLGLQDDYDPFDFELLMHINSVIAILTQLGVGPETGLTIDKDTKWSALLSNNAKLQDAKSYIFMKVKMIFDPGTMSQQVVSSYEKLIDEAEWRLRIAADPMTPPLPYGTVLDDDGVLHTVHVPVLVEDDV